MFQLTVNSFSKCPQVQCNNIHLALDQAPFLCPVHGHFAVNPGHETLASSFFSPRYPCFPLDRIEILLPREHHAGNCTGSLTVGGARHTCTRTHAHTCPSTCICTCTRTYTRTHPGSKPAVPYFPKKESNFSATGNTIRTAGGPTPGR